MDPNLTAPPPAAATIAPRSADPEDCLERFRAGCRASPLPAIAGIRAWLDQVARERRADALADLVTEHLRRCWAAGRGTRLEDYAAEFGRDFADFASADSLPVDLIEAEFIARHEFHPFGDHPGLDDYAQRFAGRPEVVEQLSARCLAGERYVKIKIQGQGGLGLVWLAYDQHLGRYVAIKEPQPALGSDPDVLKRLALEARVTARLDHPAIVAVHELHLPGAELPFYVMQLVQGRTLHQLIREYHAGRILGGRGGRRLRWNQLLKAFTAICDALAYAHARGVLHRDLKPHNVILGEFGETIVLDWGLAKFLPPEGREGARPEPQAALPPPLPPPPNRSDVATVVYAPTPVSSAPTPAGAAVGTVQYMAPEQARGIADQRSDLFGLGAILFEILTGRAPYESNEGEQFTQVWARVAEGEYPRPRDLKSDVPRALEAVCLKAMAPQPEDRHADAAAVGRDVERWLADEPVSCYRDSWPRRLARSARHHPRISGALVTALLFLLVGAWFWAGQVQRQRARQEVESLLKQGEELIAAGRYPAARAPLIEARTRLADLGEAGHLQDRLQTALAQLGKEEARGRRARFFTLADEAEFHLLGSYWTWLPHEKGEGREPITHPGEKSSDLGTGVKRAENALALYGLPADLRPLRGLARQGFDRQEVHALHRRAGELLFLLALGGERLSQGKASTSAAGRRRAVELLDQAEALGNRSWSLYHYRAEFHKALGQPQAARADHLQEKQVKPQTFLDHHFQAALAHWQGQFDRAVAEFQVALTLRPNEYWTLFRLALDLEKTKQLSQAESLLRSCSTLRPNDPGLHNSRGLMLLRQKRWPEAVEEFEAALRCRPAYLMAYRNLILAHAEDKQPARAEAVLRRFLAHKSAPREQAQGWTSLGLAYERVGNLALALKHYTTAAGLDPTFALPLRNRATIFRRLDRPREAEQDLLQATRLDPKDGDIAFVLGTEYAFQGRVPEALTAFNRALRLNPAHWQALYNRGVMLRRLRRFPEALDDQNKVLQVSPNADALHERALIRASTGDFKLALSDLNLAVGLNDRDASYLLTRGQVWSDLGGPAALRESEADLTRAIALEPNQPAAYRARGVTRMRSEDWQGALADFQHYLQLRPRAPDAPSLLHEMSVALHRLGRPKEAQAAADAGIALEASPKSLSNRGYLFLVRGELTRAAADFDRALEQDPRYTRAWVLRGLVRLLQGHPDKAVADLDRALQLKPGFYETLVLQAAAHHARGDARAARKNLEAVVGGNPDSVRVQFANGLLQVLDGKLPTAIGKLSQVVSDPVLGPVALGLRARAWLAVGGGALSAAPADASRYAARFSKEGHAQLEAARIHARAADLAGARAAAALRDRAFELLGRALKLRPDLREGLATDADLKGLRADARFQQVMAGAQK